MSAIGNEPRTRLEYLLSGFAAKAAVVDWYGANPEHDHRIAAIRTHAVASGQSPADALLQYAEYMSSKTGQALHVVQRALLALCAVELLKKRPALRSLTQNALGSLLIYLNRTTTSYKSDAWRKDTVLAFGLTEPCGVFSCDAFGRLRLPLVIGSIRRFGHPQLALDYVRWRGWGLWYEFHIDVRNLADFSPAGWKAAYRATAELLDENEHIRGAVGTTWFFDPNLANVSPELTYIADIAKEGGARFIRNRPLAIDETWATARSPARQLAVKEGRYAPTSYTLAWPRQALKAWSQGWI